MEQLVYDQRQLALEKLAKYPERVPILLFNSSTSPVTIKESSGIKEKYLVSRTLTVANFQSVLRKHINLDPQKAIFLFSKGKILPGSEKIGIVYDQLKSFNLFLEITMMNENVFGI